MTLVKILVVAIVMAPAIVRAQGFIAAVPNDATSWFQQPCLGDSADTWGWTRYDLHGIRIWVPREIRQIPVPGGDDLFFRTPRVSLQLRLHRKARDLFREFNDPSLVHRACSDNVGGLLAEVISFRLGGGLGQFGLAVNWSDADRGEYLTAVVLGRTVQDVAFLRRALYAIRFPDERRF